MNDGAYWYQCFVLGDTFIFHPFTQTTESNTSRLTDTSVRISKTRLYYRPYVLHDWCHVFATAFDRHAEGEDRATAEIGIWGLEILLDKGPERRKDLCWWQGCRQIIDYSQRRLENESG